MVKNNKKVNNNSKLLRDFVGSLQMTACTKPNSSRDWNCGGAKVFEISGPIKLFQSHTESFLYISSVTPFLFLDFTLFSFTTRVRPF